jgi:hypothetical protein
MLITSAGVTLQCLQGSRAFVQMATADAMHFMFMGVVAWQLC